MYYKMWYNKASLVVLAAHSVMMALTYHVPTNVGIYGGDIVDNIEVAPFMAYVRIDVTLSQGPVSIMCGGSVVHPQFILTAAHCTEAGAKYTITVNSTVPVEHGNVLTVTRVFAHHKYNTTTVDYDIALLQLEKPTSSPAIEIADENTVLADGDQLDIFGWGNTEIFQNPKRLRHVSLPLFDINKCKAFLNAVHIELTPRMFCGGQADTLKNVCNGDSGGPVLKGSQQVGLNSFIIQNCGTFPSVFTRVTAFKSWINDHIAEYTD